MTDIKTFIDSVGRSEIAALGFRQQEISRAIRDGVFPSGWYIGLKNLSSQRGIELPERLFRWSKHTSLPLADIPPTAGVL